MNRKERRAAARQQGAKTAPAAPAGAGNLTPDVDQLLAAGRRNQQSGQLVEAERAYRGILAIDPRHIDALQQFGVLGLQTGRPDLAVEVLSKAIALNDRIPEYHYHLGSALVALGRLDLGAAHQQRAIALKPDFIDAYNHLARTFFNLRRVDDALGVLRRAIDIGGTAETKRLFIQFLRAHGSIPDLDDLRDLMLHALSEPWARPSEVGPIAASLSKNHRAIRPYIERVKGAWPTRLRVAQLLGPSGLSEISGQRLLACLLESTPVCDVDLERFFTALRFALLEMASDDRSAVVGEQVLRFSCALARQCFLNEYVYAHSGDEIDRARVLRDSVAGAIKAGAIVPELGLAVVAAYFPLQSVTDAAALAGRTWAKPVADLLLQQVEEPEQERQLPASIPTLTAIEDEVSLRVKRQYEENPYPRWQKTEPPGLPATVDQYVRANFPLAQLQDFDATRVVDILIAGCGTGQHAIETAQRFPSARVLAVDLSLNSLGHAKRKSRALARDNIEYARADILNLASIARTFDFIEAGGVLHHLAEPFAGWRVLLSVLRPGGFMKVGLYSELARAHIKAARGFIAERGYRAVPDDIRRCRQELLGLEDAAPQKQVTRAEDFFTTSECRDLLFHVQEHRLTLPQIGAFLAQNNLTFLGFDMSAAARAKHRARFPEDAMMTDLALWQIFENENPDTFVGMYQFWVQKKAAGAGG
jgi:SAM-dependent methyltransferase